MKKHLIEFGYTIVINLNNCKEKSFDLSRYDLEYLEDENNIAFLNSDSYPEIQDRNNSLVKDGLIEKTDFVLLRWQFHQGVDKYREEADALNTQIPGVESVDWLESHVKSDGNWVWYVSPSTNDFMKRKYYELYMQDSIWEEDIRLEIDDYLDELESLPLEARKFRVRLNQDLSEKMKHFSEAQVKRLKDMVNKSK